MGSSRSLTEYGTTLFIRIGFHKITRVNMLFSPTLPARTTMEGMLEIKVVSNKNVFAEHLKNAKQC